MVVAEAGVLDGVPVVTAELLTLAEFHRVGTHDRELEPCAGDFPDVCVPVALEGIQCLGCIAPAVGGNQQVEHHVIALFYSDGLDPDGCIAGELTHHGIVGELGIGIGGEHRSDFQRLIAGHLGCQPGVQLGAVGAHAEVESAGAKQAVQVGSGTAMATSRDFHSKLSFVRGTYFFTSGVVWYAISIANCVPFVKHFFEFFSLDFSSIGLPVRL